ncbi:MAG TPA: amidohydrolase family protein [Anaerolineaceae bacterium]
MFDLILQDGIVVTPCGEYRADIGVRDGKIACIASSLADRSAANRLSVSGRYILPGCIDAHQHLWEPGMQAGPDFKDGTRASLAGGVTTIIDQPLSPPEVLDVRVFQGKKELGEATSYTDFALHAGVSDQNLDQLPALWEAGCTAFKIFMCESGTKVNGLSDGDLLAAFQTIGALGGTVMLHAENDGMLRANYNRLARAGRKDPLAFVEWHTPEAEAEAIHRALYLLRGTGARAVILHTTIPEGVAMVQQARHAGQDVWVETCPHNLYLDHTDLQAQGPWVVYAPPIRDRGRVDQLWEQLAQGAIHLMGSDPGTIDPRLKKAAEADILKAPIGIPDAETFIPLMLNAAAQGWVSLAQLSSLAAEMPAKIYGLYPRKGAIQIGSDADFTVVDLSESYTLKAAEMNTSCGWIPYEGKTITGRVIYTILRGRVAAERGRVLGQPGDGKFIQRVSERGLRPA